MAITVEMKHRVAVCVIFWTCAYPEAMSRTLYESSISVAKTHEQWMSKYRRSYADDSEKEKRFKIFKENLEIIEKFNSVGNKSYKLGLNQFSDFTKQEFIASHTGRKVSLSSTAYNSSEMASIVVTLNQSDIPTSLDWRNQGAVTHIKNQGVYCLSCWAFAAVAAIEGIVKIKTGKLISLSEQQLVDCGNNNNGCREGTVNNALDYILQNKGIAREIDYPYEGVNKACRNGIGSATEISGYVRVPINNEEQLLQAVVKQPVSAAISIGDHFRLYHGGIFNGPCGTNLNHDVTLIGYGISKDGIKYWLAKNSWGESWGEGGYMRLQRDSGQSQGVCGMATKAFYPTM